MPGKPSRMFSPIKVTLPWDKEPAAAGGSIAQDGQSPTADSSPEYAGGLR